MAYVQNNSGLGVAPAIAAQALTVGKSFVSNVSKLWGGGEKLVYPWRIRPINWPALPPSGTFRIVYGTKHQWFPVWTGPLAKLFEPGFDVSGSTDRGKWRAYQENGRIKVVEFVNDRWYPTTEDHTLDTMIRVFGYTPKLTRPFPTARTLPGPIVEAGVVPSLDGSVIPLLLAAGFVMMFVLKK